MADVRLVRRPALALLVAALVAGCASSPRPSPSGPGPRRSPAPAAPAPDAPAETRAAYAVELARSLLGVRYDYAGSDPRGFDCSGFASYVLTAAGVNLPRRAEDQAEAGVWVALDELRPGDLVFFAESRAKPHHVGLVVSEPGRRLTMIHASTSQGVVETVVSRSAYWLERLRFGRRVLDERRGH